MDGRAGNKHHGWDVTSTHLHSSALARFDTFTSFLARFAFPPFCSAQLKNSLHDVLITSTLSVGALLFLDRPKTEHYQPPLFQKADLSEGAAK